MTSDRGGEGSGARSRSDSDGESGLVLRLRYGGGGDRPQGRFVGVYINLAFGRRDPSRSKCSGIMVAMIHAETHVVVGIQIYLPVVVW